MQKIKEIIVPRGKFRLVENSSWGCFSLKATSHSTISMRGQRERGKIQKNYYHHRNCGPSLTGKTSSLSLIFTHQTHKNVKNR